MNLLEKQLSTVYFKDVRFPWVTLYFFLWKHRFLFIPIFTSLHFIQTHLGPQTLVWCVLKAEYFWNFPLYQLRLLCDHISCRGRDKSVTQPGKKQATRLGIYPTYSPRRSIHFLVRCSNFCKQLKKQKVVRPTRPPRQQWLMAKYLSAPRYKALFPYLVGARGPSLLRKITADPPVLTHVHVASGW